MSEVESRTESLGWRLFVALVTPVVLLVVVGSLLGVQIARMSETARWVDHTDEVIARTYELQKLILDQETGLRGFLLTHDRRFLQPYEEARPLDKLGELRALTVDNSEHQARLTDLQNRYVAWAALTRDILDGKTADAGSTEEMLSRKTQMDGIRAVVDRLLEAEGTLRRTRTQALDDSNRTTRWLFVGLLAGTAVFLAIFSRRNLSSIARTFSSALGNERAARAAIEEQQWIRTGQNKVSDAVQGDLTIEELGRRALGAIAEHVGADVGAFFAMDAQRWRRRAGFALDTGAAGPETFALGEGLIGRAAEARSPTHLKDVPADLLRVRSGLGEAVPREIVVAPATFEGVANGVVELAFLHRVEPRVVELLRCVAESIGVAIRSAEYKARLRELLEESQRQAEELQTQQEELRVANEELTERSNALREAHAQLEERREELEASNASLKEQAAELERAEKELRDKATEVERGSRYKSEFLANMSHELRTPLNSTLILAKLLADNRGGNLDAEQIRYAETIYNAGNDLLTLINDVLDLAKIEAGKVDVHATRTPIARLVSPVTTPFEAMAKEKGLAFEVRVDPNAPPIETDVQRAQQILRNLLSNAFKFTEKGRIEVEGAIVGDRARFVVRDSGIGVPKDQQETIFEAFRQADGTTNRKYGGTGLGLSISRDLARLLGGDLTLESAVGKGSAFTLDLPRTYGGPATVQRIEPAVHAPPPRRPSPIPPSPSPPEAHATVEDDRATIDRSKKTLLVVEDDASFARILVDLGHELEFQVLAASTAKEALKLIERHLPTAVILDLHLPDHSGLSVLDRLKRNPATRHVPVHCVSVENYAQRALEMGAMGYILKPVAREELVRAVKAMEERITRRIRRLLVVEDDPVQRESIGKLLSGPDVEVIEVGTVAAALERLRATTIDCVVTDLTLPDASGFELLDKMAEDESVSVPPVIVYTGRSLTEDEEQRLRRHSSSIIIKGARSPERLLDEATLFLHQIESELPAERQRMLRTARDRERIFEGRRILVVEDDARNIFALSALLEPRGAKVLIARNGREALETLEKDAAIDLVLMDVMMPEMDGVQATREIRRRPKWAKLPIIALTAKVMKDDQERCLKAGANDYVSKPLDVEMLLSLLRVWMPK